MGRVTVTVDVALVPSQVRLWSPTVCLVVDQLRASSTVVSALEMGCTELRLASSIREARRLSRVHGSILAGEQEGVRPPGFDANNSPAELAGLELGGRSLVLCTTNGTVVMGRLGQMSEVLVGCLANARAAATTAIADARALGTGVGIVCAGRHGSFALDDAYTAGILVERLIAVARGQDVECPLSDAAEAVRELRSTLPDPMTAFLESSTAELMLRLGAGADLEICARVDWSATVPMVRTGPPLRVIRHPAGTVARRAAG